MKKNKFKPEASLSTTCIAGYENEELFEFLDMVEKDLKIFAKKYGLKISAFVELFDAKWR